MRSISFPSEGSGRRRMPSGFSFYVLPHISTTGFTMTDIPEKLGENEEKALHSTGSRSRTVGLELSMFPAAARQAIASTWFAPLWFYLAALQAFS